MRCARCGNVTATDEEFYDIKCPVEAGSVRGALETLCATERLCGKEQYECERCGCKVDAERCLSWNKLPRVLAIHLLRFRCDQLPPAPLTAARTHTHAHAHTHARTHTRTHARTHAHTHTHNR